MTTGSQLTFEEALRELETLVERLESGELPLEEALVLYERGVALAGQCNRLLEAAERRIEILKDAAGDGQTVETADGTLFGQRGE